MSANIIEIDGDQVSFEQIMKDSCYLIEKLDSEIIYLEGTYAFDKDLKALCIHGRAVQKLMARLRHRLTHHRETRAYLRELHKAICSALNLLEKMSVTEEEYFKDYLNELPRVNMDLWCLEDTMDLEDIFELREEQREAALANYDRE